MYQPSDQFKQQLQMMFRNAFRLGEAKHGIEKAEACYQHALKSLDIDIQLFEMNRTLELPISQISTQPSQTIQINMRSIDNQPSQTTQRNTSNRSSFVPRKHWVDQDEQILLEKVAEYTQKSMPPVWVEIREFLPNRTAESLRKHYHLLKRKRYEETVNTGQETPTITTVTQTPSL
jgi:hypothetical protein